MQYAKRQITEPVTEDEWTEKFNLLTSEHKLKGAREQLSTGWKQWFAAPNPCAAAIAVEGSAAEGPAAKGAATDIPFMED